MKLPLASQPENGYAVIFLPDVTDDEEVVVRGLRIFIVATPEGKENIVTDLLCTFQNTETAPTQLHIGCIWRSTELHSCPFSRTAIQYIQGGVSAS